MISGPGIEAHGWGSTPGGGFRAPYFTAFAGGNTRGPRRYEIPVAAGHMERLPQAAPLLPPGRSARGWVDEQGKAVEGNWTDLGNDQEFEVTPTHWMPLSEPPK